jgi:hypothetical protein
MAEVVLFRVGVSLGVTQDECWMNMRTNVCTAEKEGKCGSRVSLKDLLMRYPLNQEG